MTDPSTPVAGVPVVIDLPSTACDRSWFVSTSPGDVALEVVPRRPVRMPLLVTLPTGSSWNVTDGIDLSFGPFVIGDTPERLSGTWTCDDPAAGSVTLTADMDEIAPPASRVPVAACPHVDDRIVVHAQRSVACAS